jgi:hypothetical protein
VASVVEPAASGTTMVTGRADNVCAGATGAQTAQAARAKTRLVKSRMFAFARVVAA